MATDPRQGLTPPQTTPGAPSSAGVDRPDEGGESPKAAHGPAAFASDGAAEPAGRPGDRPRPPANFAAPISLPLDDAPEPALRGGEIPPLYADAETAEPHLAPPREVQPLPRRIHQGMPSYFEPEPQIAGVIGRAARGGGEGGDLDDPNAPAPRDGGTP